MRDKQKQAGFSAILALVLAVCVLGLASGADAGSRTPNCPIAGDAMGESVAFGGDFDGDGVADIATGSPCAMVRRLLRGGRVAVFSGATGLKIFGAKGTQAGQFLGASVAFSEDLDGDGRAELVVGSPGYNVLSSDRPDDLATGKKFRDGGRVDLFSCADNSNGNCTADPAPLTTWFGQVDQAMLGRSVAATTGGIASSAADIVAGAPGDRVARNNGKRGQRKGRVHFYSGGALDLPDPFISIDGPKKGSRFGNVIAVVKSIDNDLIDDIAVGAEEANIGAKKTGLVRALSGDSPSDKIFDESGAKKDRMGSAVAPAGDLDFDGRADLIVGSATADDAGLKNAGTVTVLSANGQPLLVAADTEAARQTGARFGSAVARIGDINDDGIDDYAVGAPHQDTRVQGQLLVNAGRVVAISGADGSEIWSLDGTRPGMRLGYRLLAGPESGKGYARLLVGAPGDAPRGRRGAGTLRMLAGNSKQVIETFRGQRGLETRVFTFGYDRASVPVAKTFGLKARAGELRAEVGGASFRDLSVAVLDDSRNANSYSKVKVILAAGSSAGNDGRVVVMDARSRNKAITSFKAFNSTSVNVGAGRIDSNPLHPSRYEEKIVAVEAYSATGNVKARTFARVNARKDDQWAVEREFAVFAKADTLVQSYGGTYGITTMMAQGANIAVGDVLGDKHEEIVVGSVLGVPRVRVYSYTGALQAEFVAYVPDADGNGIVDTKGVRVAVGNVAGDNRDMIITVPMQGAPVIRVFDGYGDRMEMPGSDDVVEIDPRCEQGAGVRESGYCGGYCSDGGAFSNNIDCAGDSDCPSGSTCVLPGTCATPSGVTNDPAVQCFSDDNCQTTMKCKGQEDLFIGTEYCATDTQCANRGLSGCYLGQTCLDADYAAGGHVATANLDFDRRQEIVFMPGARSNRTPVVMAFDAATGEAVTSFREYHPFATLTNKAAALAATDGYAR